VEQIISTSTLPAIISALIAILIFFVSQWFLARKTAIELKTKKLEELYLALNELSVQHVVRFERVRAIANGDRTYLDDPKHAVTLYLNDLNKQIIMFVRLYFPKLAKSHQALFRANQKVNDFIFQVMQTESVDSEVMIKSFLDFGGYIGAMESELIDNRKLLVGENVFPRLYKKSTPQSTRADQVPPEQQRFPS